MSVSLPLSERTIILRGSPMADFITQDFLLRNPAAIRLYHEYAESLPIVDYHTHLSPVLISDDASFGTIADAWLGGDHYKWRLMRSNGAKERVCSGSAPGREKFGAWADTVPKALRNPLYHWTHLELKRFFGVNDLLGPDTAEKIWNACNDRLSEPTFTVRSVLSSLNVLLVCTTDDPVDTLEHHIALANDPTFPTTVLPTFRPDKALAVEDPADFNAWVAELERASDTDIVHFADFVAALRSRHDFFHENGCRLSDRGLERPYGEDFVRREIEVAFDSLRSRKGLSGIQRAKFKSAMLCELGRMDCEKAWAQQLHIGALRNPNTRRFGQLGPNTGFDCIGDCEVARPMTRLLDRMESDDNLPKTVLYNLNPRDNELLAVLAGSFQDSSIPGKIQYGTAWWFLDQRGGIEKQIEALSATGLLGRFVGMVTDSRSFLSFPRHEYFRRVLCSILGSDIEDGAVPRDFDLVGEMVRDICYRNAVAYFDFDVPIVETKGNHRGSHA